MQHLRYYQNMNSRAANIINDIRSSRQLSMNTLADLAGIPVSTISRIEAGAVEPTVSMLNRIATAAGFTVKQLVEEAGTDEPFARFLDQLASESPKGKQKLFGKLSQIAALAPVAQRAGVVRYESPADFSDFLNELITMGQRPIVSSLEAYANDYSVQRSFYPIIYVDKKNEIVNLKPAEKSSFRVMFVLPATDNVRRFCQSSNGVAMTSREWALLDALASPGRQADAVMPLLRLHVKEMI
jgi:transcriptional regulator with XRE-family HTH domain